MIAQKALPLIKPGDTILLDGGTTTYALAGLLDMPLTIITNNIPVAALLAGRKDMEVIVTGGRIQPDSQATVGAPCDESAGTIACGYIFSWCLQSSPHIGVTSLDYFECEVKRAMVDCSDRIVALTGHDKVGTSEAYKICPIDKLDTIITEISPDNEMFEPYRQRNIQIL